jgi:hypothetical protein
MGNFLEKILGREYTFTVFIPELVKPLNKNKGLILANLLTKYATLNSENTVRRIYGKEYHFYFSKKDIALKELLIDYSDFNKYMDALSEYVSTFGSRQKGNEGYNTTYFFLHLDKIQALFDKGAEMLGRKIRKQSDDKEQKQKLPKPSMPKGLPANIAKNLDSMNETELKYRNGSISEEDYKPRILELKGLIRKNGVNIVNNNNVWKIVP